jgi:hypothetical protein
MRILQPWIGFTKVYSVKYPTKSYALPPSIPPPPPPFPGLTRKQKIASHASSEKSTASAVSMYLQVR